MANNFVVRVATGIVLIPIVLAATWFGVPFFAMLVIVFALLLAWEWNVLFKIRVFGISAQALILVILASLMLGAAGQVNAAILVLAAGIAAMVIFQTVIADNRPSRWHVVGLPYIALPCLALILMRGDQASGAKLIFWLLAIVWASDIGAYGFGRLIGGPRLAPAISPNKTWAGFVGGLVCAAAVGWAFAVVSDTPFVVLLVFSAIVGLGAQLGDLLESWVKRKFGVKDMGRIIPGHGGAFDRVDGLLLASPIAMVINKSFAGGII